LLGERFQVFGSERRVVERLELSVDTNRRRTSDLEMKVGSIAAYHLLQHQLEIDAALGNGCRDNGIGDRLNGVSHWDRA
jgi:hypothetical protein